MPPCAGARTIVRVRVCEPVPHDSVHEFHDAQFDTMQSMGHACSLQGSVCVCWKVSHGFPPPHATYTGLRERLRIPPPHVFEHAPQLVMGPSHACILQSSGLRVHLLAPASPAVHQMRKGSALPPVHGKSLSAQEWQELCSGKC